MKQSVNSTLAKLGQCMATLEGGNFIEMVERMEEKEVRSASCDEESNTITSTADNEVRDEVYTAPKTFLDVESSMLH